ncbi:MAG TPA: glycosyltransferase family 39 protein [Stellaceae bacterium]|jgi:hypothetical protein
MFAAQAEGQGARGAVDRHDALALGLLFVLFVIVLATFTQYGTTWDEDYHFWYAHQVIAYYTSFFHDRTALTSPPISYYGALFDVATALVAPISPFGDYATRHLINALIGIVGIAGCWRLAREIGGSRAGLLAAILLALTPGYYGHMFNNPKDIPFAAGYVWALYYMVRLVPLLPRPPRALVIKLGIATGLALGVRVGALLLPCYLGLLLLVVPGLAAWRARRPSLALAPLLIETGAVLAPMLAISYAIMLLAWPWAQLDPLWRPIADIVQFDHHNFPYKTLFAGAYYPAPLLPRIYLPAFFLVQLPELFVLLLGIGLVWGLAQWRRARWPLEQLLPVGLVVFAAVFPIAFAMATHATLFDGLRHFLFVEPPLACCAALTFDAILRRARRWPRPVAAGASAALLGYTACHLAVMVALHPDEYVYYNLFVGGVPGAAGRYKLDYWANSYHEAADDLVAWLKARDGARFADKVYRVADCGPGGSLKPYLPPNLVYEDRRDRAEFFIAFTQDNCDKLMHGAKVAEVDRLGTRLSVVLDLRQPQLARRAGAPKAN